jgi:hypothetical protein
MYRPSNSGRTNRWSLTSHRFPPAHLMNGFNASPTPALSEPLEPSGRITGVKLGIAIRTSSVRFRAHWMESQAGQI